MAARSFRIFRALRTSLRLHRSNDPDPILSGLALGYFGGCAALLMHSVAATTFTTIRTTEPFFFATGILYAYWNLRRKQIGHSHPGSRDVVELRPHIESLKARMRPAPGTP